MEFIIKLVCNFLTGCMAVDFTAGLIGFIIIIICTRADAIASDSWIYLIPDQLSGTFQTHAKKLLEITIPKILSEMLQWLAKLAKDALASAQVCVFSA